MEAEPTRSDLDAALRLQAPGKFLSGVQFRKSRTVEVEQKTQPESQRALEKSSTRQELEANHQRQIIVGKTAVPRQTPEGFKMQDDLHPTVAGFVVLMSVATSIYGLYCTFIAFVGGTIQPLGWELEGSGQGGLVWLVLITPIITTVAYWLTMLIAMPLAAVLRSK